MANIWMYNLASHVEIPNYAPGYYSIHGWIVTQFSHMKKLFVMNIKVKVPRLTALTRICHERERWFKIIIIIIKIKREREREWWNWFQREGQTTCFFNKLKVR